MSNSPRNMTLPIDSAERKNYPLLSGCLKYFPAALAGVANTSKLGNDKHNPGQELHHARGKSMDHGDCILRHLTDTEDLLAKFKAFNGHNDSPLTAQILVEVNQLAWRALAYSQELHEQLGAPLAPGAVLADQPQAFSKNWVDELNKNFEKLNNHNNDSGIGQPEYDYRTIVPCVKIDNEFGPGVSVNRQGQAINQAIDMEQGRKKPNFGEQS